MNGAGLINENKQGDESHKEKNINYVASGNRMGDLKCLALMVFHNPLTICKPIFILLVFPVNNT